MDSITDWKVGVTYDLSGWLLGASYIGTNRDLTGGTAALSTKNISNGTVVRVGVEDVLIHNACEGVRNEDGDRDRQAVQARRSA